MTQEKILEKLGKIKAHMESAKEIGNEAEAQAFAAMLQKLLLQHKLEMTDIQYQREMQDEPIIEHTPETMWETKSRAKRAQSVTELTKLTWNELPQAVRTYLLNEGSAGDCVTESDWVMYYNSLPEGNGYDDEMTRYKLLYFENGVGMTNEFPPEKWYRGSAFKQSHRRVYKDYPDVEVIGKRRAWAEQLAGIVAEAYACRILVSTGSSIIHFVGHKSNVAIAEYLFITMLRVAEKLSDKAAMAFRRKWREDHGGAGSTPQGYRESFLEGFVGRIAQRLREERQKFEGPNTSTALVRVNKEALAVRQYMDNKKVKNADAIGGRRNFNREGYREGQRVADSLDINGKAVREGQANKQLS